MTRAEVRALARAEHRAMEARQAQERRERVLQTILFIIGLTVIILGIGFAGGIERGTIHVFGL